MGSFSVACAISKVTISEGDRCVIVPLIPNPRRLNRLNSESIILSPMEYFIPLCLQIKGEYDDYGSIKKIEKNDNTKAIEKFFGISIEDFVDIITVKSVDIKHGLNLNTLNSLSCMFVHGDVYDYYLSKKKLHDKSWIHRWMLTEMGFEHEESSIRKFIKKVYAKTIIAKCGTRGIEMNGKSIYDIKSFKECYDALALTDLDVSKYENIDSSFAEIKENIYVRSIVDNFPDSDKASKDYKEYMLSHMDYDCPIAVGLYRDWPLFEELYKDVLPSNDIDELLKEYAYFYWSIYFTNTMFFPSFCGNQFYNADNELELSEIIKMIADKRKNKDLVVMINKEVYLVTKHSDCCCDDDFEFYHYLIEKEQWDEFKKLSENDLEKAVEYLDLKAPALIDSGNMNEIFEYVRENKLVIMGGESCITEY